MRKTVSVCFLIFILLIPALLAQPQPRSALDSLIDQLFAVRNFNEVAISPDGKHVAWSEWLHDRSGAPTANSAIYVTDLPPTSAAPRRITAATDGKSYAERNLDWAPDGKQLAFLSDASGQAQLYTIDISGGAARKLTSINGYLSNPRWSPDGKTIALVFIENAPRAAGPLMAMTPETGLVETTAFEQRLTTVDVGSGQTRQLSPSDTYVYEYDWSPDGKSFALTAAHGAGDANWYIAQLYILAAESGAMKAVYKPPLQIAIPRWSPDGKSIAFIAGIMSDEGSTGGDIFLVPAAGGEVHNLTPGIKSSPNWLAWNSPDEILFSEIADGSTAYATLAVSSGKVNTLWTGAEAVGTGGWGELGLSLSRDHKNSAVVRQSFSQPPEVWTGRIGQWSQVTHANQQLRANWGKTESLHWTNENLGIQGWLMYPANYDPNKKYPLIVDVHGGPGAAHMPSWPESFFNTSLLSAMNYFVLYPNPRGSFGQGEDFTRANVKDFGYGDLRDILAGVDHLVKTFPVDNNRIGITGWSYGGFMTMWTVTQTNRFHAAVSGAGIANWQSYYGENDIDQWMIPFFGASVYDDPQVYARSAPINFIRNVKTPTLVLVGERDGECPAPQSREFWHALRTFGVSSDLVIYANEGHLILSPEHRRDIIRRSVDWFDKYLAP